MMTHATGREKFVAVLRQIGAAAAVALVVTSAAPAADPPRVRLGKPVEVVVAGVDVDAVAALADNESVVLVGGKPRGPADGELATEDAPPAGAIVNLKTQTVRLFTNEHTARIKGVAAAADGLRIFTVCSDKDPFVRVWGVEAGKPVGPLPLPQLENYYSTHEVACVPGSRKIAVGFRDRVAFIDPDGRERQQDLTAEEFTDDTPRQLSFSPDGDFLACCNFRKKVVVWDIRIGKVVCSVSLLPDGEDHRDWSFTNLAFTRDGTRLIASRSGNADEVPNGTAEDKVAPERRGLFVIDIKKQQIAPLSMGHQIHTFAFALHPSGDWIATVGPSRPDGLARKDATEQVGELRVYHLPTRSLAHRVQFDDEFFPSKVLFTPNGKRMVAVDVEGKVRSWDFATAGK